MQRPWFRSNCALWLMSLAACNRDFSEATKEPPRPPDETDSGDKPDPSNPPEREAAADVDDVPNPATPHDASDETDSQGNTETTGTATSSGTPSMGHATSMGNAPDWSAAFDGVYDFEEPGLSLGNDSSGRGHHLQVEGEPEQSSDRKHGAFSVLFDNQGAAEGTQQRPLQSLFTMHDFTRTLDSSSVTLGAWVRSPLNTANHDYTIVANGDTYAGGVNLKVRLDLMAVLCTIGANLEATSIDETFVADHREWHHIACRYDDDAKQVQYFVDGVAPEAPVDIPNGIGQGWGRLHVGQGFTGALDEVFFVKRALSDAQIARIWGCGVNGKGCNCSPSTPAEYESCGSQGDCGDTQLPPCDSVLEP